MITGWPAPLSGYVQTENIYLNANAEGDDKNAGWAFMEFFMSAEAQALLTEVGHIPAISGVAVDDPLVVQQAAAQLHEPAQHGHVVVLALDDL